MRITVVGTGYVGLVSGTCFANTGNDVICLDLDEDKVAKLQAGISPIYEPGLDELIARSTATNRLQFTTDKEQAYSGPEAMFICVGTPSDEMGRADLSYVMAAAADIGEALERRAETPEGRLPPIVVVKSTVPVGTNARVRAAIEARTSHRFAMASNPEFLKEGDAIRDFYKPDRVVVGVEDEDVGLALTELYKPYVRRGRPILVMDIPSAEMVKYASNAMLATKISFINEIANLCEAYGAEITHVRTGMCADTRIGDQFLYPGLGYGGSCFPKDVLACVSMGDDADVPTQLLRSVHEVNQRQRQQFLSKLDKHFHGNVAGRRFAIWGLSFKPRTDDIREAPSLTIIDWLLERGASVVAYDPVAIEAARRVLGDRIEYADRDMPALDGADALVICTEWSDFRNPDFDEMKQRLGTALVFDGRNIYDPQKMVDMGFVYYSVGRRPVGL
jgi:UDPglucose 6-dehydrogenase